MKALVKEAQAGDHRAFEELVRRTYLDSYTLAVRMLGNAEDARDVVQETYVKVHKGLKKFRGDSKFSTWLYRITANCAKTYMVSQSRHAHASLEDSLTLVDESLEGNPDHRGVVLGLRSDLSAALLELPVGLRSVIVLRDIYDLPHSAIAKELEISESAAKVRLHRARFKLKEKLYPLYRGDHAELV